MSDIKRSQYKQQPVNPQIRIDYLNHFSSCTWRPVWRTSDCQRKVQKHAFLFCNSTLGGQSVAFVWPGFLPRIACLTSQTSVSLKTEILHLFEYFYNPAHTCQVSALSLFVCVRVCVWDKAVISTWVTEQARATGMMLSHLWRCFQNRRVRVRLQDQLSLLTKENHQIRPSGPAH